LLGATFGGYTDADKNGHGTATASIAVGNALVTAPGSNAIAVKVISDSGEAYTSDIIPGIQWIIDAASSSGRPSVVNMGFSGSPKAALNQMARSVLDAGIHVTTAAGDNSAEAGGYGPGQGE